MRVEDRVSSDSVRQARDRFVPRGVSGTELVVTRAWGARIWDAEGREYLDFGGGIACQNLGHGNATVVRAIHGRTNLTMAMTAKLVYKQGFGPLATDVHRAPAPYPYRGVSTEDALHGVELLFRQDVDPEEVACVVLEPVQGEGGFIPMPPEFVHALRTLCDRHGILYVDDEIQAGCGRTGTLWAIEHFGVEPDILVSGKTLGGGLPL